MFPGPRHKKERTNAVLLDEIVFVDSLAMTSYTLFFHI